MKVRDGLLTRKHDGRPTTAPVTDAISPEAKSRSFVESWFAEEQHVVREFDSFPPAQAIREYSRTLQELTTRARKMREFLLTRVYAQGLRLMRSQIDYDEFRSDPFWEDRPGAGPKPDGQHEAVRFAIIRALDAKTLEENKAATRDGNAFQQLANDGVKPEDLWTTFKERGGRDTLAREYVASRDRGNPRIESKRSGKQLARPEQDLKGEVVRHHSNFLWDIPNKRIEIVSAFIGVQDGEFLSVPIGVRVVDGSLPDLALDPTIVMALRRGPAIKSKKPRK